MTIFIRKNFCLVKARAVTHPFQRFFDDRCLHWNVVWSTIISTNGSDYVNIYKYSLDDVKTGIAKCNDTYGACYQTIYSEGNSLYMTVGYAKDADDIGDVRKFVEYISYPGNPSLTREAEENAAGNSDKSESGTSSKKSGGETNSSDSDTEENASASSSDSSDDSDIRTTSPMTLVDSEGNTIEINYIMVLAIPITAMAPGPMRMGIVIRSKVCYA